MANKTTNGICIATGSGNTARGNTVEHGSCVHTYNGAQVSTLFCQSNILKSHIFYGTGIVHKKSFRAGKIGYDMALTIKHAGVIGVDGNAGPALTAHIDVSDELSIYCVAAAVNQLSKSHKLLRRADFIRGLLRTLSWQLGYGSYITYLPIHGHTVVSL